MGFAGRAGRLCCFQNGDIQYAGFFGHIEFTDTIVQGRAQSLSLIVFGFKDGVFGHLLVEGYHLFPMVLVFPGELFFPFFCRQIGLLDGGKPGLGKFLFQGVNLVLNLFYFFVHRLYGRVIFH